METDRLDEPGRQRGPLAAPADTPDAGAYVPGAAGSIQEFNAADKIHEELRARARQAGGAVRHRREEERLARQEAGEEHRS
jgi:hypothetical protein